MSELPEYRWPTSCYPSMVQMDWQAYAITSRQPLRGSRRAGGPLVEVWEARLTFEGLVGAEMWAPLRAFLGRLRGTGGLIRMWDASRRLPRGMGAGVNMTTRLEALPGQPFSDGSYFADGTGWTDAGTAGVVAAAAEAKSEWLLIGGLVAAQPLALAASDLIEVGGRLHECLTDAPSDAQGRALVQIGPRLRAPALVGDRVALAFPSSPFQLVDKRPELEIRGGGLRTEVGLQLVEYLP